MHYQSKTKKQITTTKIVVLNVLVEMLPLSVLLASLSLLNEMNYGHFM